MRLVWGVIKAVFSRQFFLATAAVVLGMGQLARLGFWQLDRLEQRRAAMPPCKRRWTPPQSR